MGNTDAGRPDPQIRPGPAPGPTGPDQPQAIPPELKKELEKTLESLKDTLSPKALEQLKETIGRSGRPGEGVFRYIGPPGARLELKVPLPPAGELLKALEPLKEELSPKVWERIKESLEKPERPAPEGKPDRPKPEAEKPKPGAEPERKDLETRREVLKRVEVRAQAGDDRRGEAATTISISTDKYRAVWEKKTGQPTLVSLYDARSGKAILEKLPADQLKKKLESLDDEARELLSKSRIDLKVQGREE